MVKIHVNVIFYSKGLYSGIVVKQGTYYYGILWRNQHKN